jgi:hypothetical protein
MTQKLMQDFFEAHEIDKLIIKEQLGYDPGVRVFKNMIRNVVDDIKTLDKKTYEQLNEKIGDLNKTNIERKKQIEAKVEEPEDSISRRALSSTLLIEDYKKYHKILNLIQDISYKKGWFD